MKITQKIIDDLEKALDMRRRMEILYGMMVMRLMCVSVVRLLLTNLLVY